MKAMRGVQMAAKGVGEAFTGGRDLHQMLHALHSTTVSVEAYFGEPAFARVLPENLKQWAASLCGEAKESYERLRKRVEQMEKDGVRGAAESSLHALSSAAGAITGKFAVLRPRRRTESLHEPDAVSVCDRNRHARCGAPHCG
ncbi:hypothetical protein N9995_00030 [bacterium]|jgi:hypothetical protein|nr:hypothetical protein [bacterium]